MANAQAKRRPAALMMVLLLSGSPEVARSQDLPTSVLHDWQYYNNTGWRAVSRGNDDRAAQAFRIAIETLRPYQATQRELLARSNADYARVLCRQKRHAEAEPLARWALTVREALPGVRSEALCQNLELLAQIHRARGRHAEAEPLLKRMAELQSQNLGPDHPDLIPTFEALADVYSAQNKVAEAEPLYRRVLALREASSADNLKKAETLEQAASLLRLMGNSTSSLQAERQETQARRLREATAESVGSAATTRGYATMLRRAGRDEEAVAMEAKAKAILDAVETRAARDRVRAGR